MKTKPLEIPVLKCKVCRHRRKPRVEYKAPIAFSAPMPSMLWFSVRNIEIKHDGGFRCFCPVCGAKHDLILERVEKVLK